MRYGRPVLPYCLGTVVRCSVFSSEKSDATKARSFKESEKERNERARHAPRASAVCIPRFGMTPKRRAAPSATDPGFPRQVAAAAAEPCVRGYDGENLPARLHPAPQEPDDETQDENRSEQDEPLLAEDHSVTSLGAGAGPPGARRRPECRTRSPPGA